MRVLRNIRLFSISFLLVLIGGFLVEGLIVSSENFITNANAAKNKNLEAICNTKEDISSKNYDVPKNSDVSVIADEEGNNIYLTFSAS